MNTGQRVVFRLPYVDERHCDLERRVRSTVHRAFDDVNVVTVYNVRRAFLVMKDVLPTNLLSKVVYSFEWRQCDSWYVGRTLQHLNVRIKQHVTLHLLSSEARGSRPRRGRSPRASMPVTQLALILDIECDAMVKVGVRRSVRLQKEKTSDGTVNGRDNVDSLKTISTKEYHSAIARHLSLNKEWSKAYCDDCFSVLSRARSHRHLKVLESVYIRVQRPDLCVQKETVKPLLLFKSHLAPVS